jgi:2-polyprenyl-3-methyl-5-hydroxy-6-metoxy-1,4-benzoquinol methylase
MEELYRNYYTESLSQNKIQRADLKTFALVSRKFDWNYRRFLVQLPRDAAILDLGCGLGQFVYYLTTQGFMNVQGVDISADLVQLAQQIQPDTHFTHTDDSIRFLRSNVESFDVITMNDVLEHVPLEQLIPVMHAVYAALKSGGFVLIKTINAAFPFGYASRYMDLTHTISFHEKSLTQLLRHTGFAEIKCFQEEIGIYNPLFLFKKLIVVCVRTFVRALIYFSEADWPHIISLNLIAYARKQ